MQTWHQLDIVWPENGPFMIGIQIPMTNVWEMLIYPSLLQFQNNIKNVTFTNH